jgi:hypothetical protein
MKVIIPQLQIQVLHDIAQCLESINEVTDIESIYWDSSKKPIIDMFDEVRPEIIMLHESQLDDAFAVVAQEFDFKYVLIAEKLPAQLSKPPDAVITTAPFLQNFPEHYSNLDSVFSSPIPSHVMEVKHLTRLAQIHGGSYNSNMKSEVLVDTTGIEINDIIFDTLSFLTSNYKTKIIGNSVVKLHHYLGIINIFERANFIKSTQVMVDFNGSGVWDASYLRVPSITVNNADNPHILQFNSIPELKNNIDSILGKKLVRDKYIDLCYKEVLKGNTYHHFTAELFKNINEPDIADCLTTYVGELLQ